jgi:hypothetical protein
MTVLAAIGRAVLGAVLVLTVLASCLWVRFGPQGAWTLARIVLVFAVVSCTVPAWIALQPKGDGGHG